MILKGLEDISIILLKIINFIVHFNLEGLSDSLTNLFFFLSKICW